MDERMTKLRKFISDYAIDFLEDGTKDYILERIDSDDKELALEILNAMDEDWVKLANELHKFYIFSDQDYDYNPKKNNVTYPYIKANYIGPHDQGGRKIPTLRKMGPRVKYITYPDYR